MIRADQSESFPILVSLFDEEIGQLSSGELVYYDIRNMDDTPLSPPKNGLLTESTFEPGLYKKVISISNPGIYICYSTCSGFLTSSEEIIINETSIYDLLKQNRHYNISVENVSRSNDTPTNSQTTRKVPLGATDYIITRIKRDQDPDWSGAHTVSGYVYAWYNSDTDEVPYRMGSQT
jgi:hypothetical protein